MYRIACLITLCNGWTLKSPTGEYQIMSDMSVGGDGAIYEAIVKKKKDNPDLMGKQVVVKCARKGGMTLEYYDEQKKLSEMIMESWAPRLIEYFVSGPTKLPCIVQERLGSDLGRIRDELFPAKTKLPLETLGSLGVLMVDAIRQLHTKYGYNHRDLHAGNWMVSSTREQLKLIDFGDAKPYDSAYAQTDLREVAMTIRFMYDGDHRYYSWKHSGFNKKSTCERIPVRVCDALLHSESAVEYEDLRNIFMDMIFKAGKSFTGEIIWPIEKFKTPLSYPAAITFPTSTEAPVLNIEIKKNGQETGLGLVGFVMFNLLLIQ